MEQRLYAGIGSRRTPMNILLMMQKIGMFLGRRGFTLRTGAATGADQSFMRGCKLVGSKAELYLPWKGFEHKAVYALKNREVHTVTDAAIDIAGLYHPAWDRCSDTVKKLHGRNVMVMLGYRFDSPVGFVVCYTQDANVVGGTGQALRIAKEYGIPVVNLGGDLQKAKNSLIRLSETAE